jgi:hypothetical protein
MYNTGDIIVNNAGAFGHVAMCFDEEDADGVGAVTFIHGTNKGNFSIDEKVKVIDEVKSNFWHFKPKNFTADNKAKIKEVAGAIQRSAKYGLYRAVRLFVGSSAFGKDARKRLDKYKERLAQGGKKLVTTITCVEAVVLCYQLTFDESSAYFIQKDAAHTMPRTLAEYLKASPAGWKTEQSPP